LTAIHVLLLVGLVEVAVNRIAVPWLRPSGLPPAWHTALDYLGLFSFYFAGTLATLLLASRCWRVVVAPGGWRTRAAGVAVALAAALAAIPLVIDAPAVLSVTLEIAFPVAVIAVAVASIGKRWDLGIQIGLPLVAIPFLIHGLDVIGGRFLWPDNTFDGPGVVVGQAGVVALCLAALTSPYCFAPRPFARAVARPGPVIAAIAIAGLGAWLARAAYPELARAAGLAIGVELTPSQADPRLAMYLLAIATLVWTLVSCATAATAARRSVGAGLTLIVLGGYAFKWPHHYLLPLVGLMLIGEAVRGVRDAELAATPITSETPPIGDAAWSSYLSLVIQGLRRVLVDVHSLTTRGEAGLGSSVIVGEAGGLAVRARIDRIDGCVLGLDVVVGRELDEHRAATFTVWSIPPRALGVNPASPPATPAFKSGDPPFDERFKLRGSALAFHKLFDDGLRARATATIDGWIAYWEGEGVRYRVYPGRGAPVDHPLPLSDLALGRASASSERLVTVIELLIELAGRGRVAAPVAASEPAEPAAPTELA
jgi:hypothetical protein